MKKIMISLICILAIAVSLIGCDSGRGEITTRATTGAESTRATTGSSASTPTETTAPDSTGNGNMDTTTAGTVLTTLPLFARLDFGTNTAAEERGQTTHAYITDALTYNSDFITVEFTDDTLRITAKKDGTFSAAGETATLDDSKFFQRGTNTCYYTLSDFALCFDDLVTYDFDDELRSGYGTWANYPFTFGNVGDATAWRGYHQYMKIRLLNPTDNDKIAVQFNNSMGYASTQFMVMSIGKQKNTFESYIYDLCYAATYASGKGVLLAGQNPGNNWTWKQDTLVQGLRFHLLGSTASYANAYLNNSFAEGETAADYDAYSEYFNRLDTRALIKEGNTVEIDYIVFGSTPGQLEAYKSRMEETA